MRTSVINNGIAVSLLASAALQYQVSADPSFLTNGLVSYYPFTGSVNDASGFGADPSVADVKLVADRFSIGGSAAEFDGTHSMIVIPRAAVPPLPPQNGLTISAWVKANTLAQIPVVEFSDSQNIGVQMWLGAITPSALFENLRDTILRDHLGVTHAGTIVTNQYQHVMTSYDYSRGVLVSYIDGVVAGTFALGQVNFDTSEPLLIGYRANPFNAAKFNGVIDDVRIYGRGLRPDEARALYLRELAVPLSHPAVAKAQGVNGFVVGATVLDGGAGYTGVPNVRVTGGGGSGASVRAVVTNGVVTELIVDDAGAGYNYPPSIVVDPPVPIPARAMAVSGIELGQVIGVSPVGGGYGYTNTPLVRLVGGGGIGATAVAEVRGYEVVAITVTNPGSGYVNPPLVQIESPNLIPSVAIEVKRVAVKLSVRLGHTYQLESSTDLLTWTSTGPDFVADDETIVKEFDVTQSGQYFRLIERP